MPDFVGLDIGTTAVKGIQVKNKSLISYGEAATGVSILSENSSDLQKISKTLDQFFSENFKTRNVVASVPESQVFTRLVTLPQMGGAEIASAVQNLPTNNFFNRCHGFGFW